MANNEAGRISLGLNLDSRPIRQQANTLQSQLEHTFSGIGRKIGAALSVKALVDFSKQCLDLGSDLAEVQNVVDVTFTSMNGKVNEFAQNAAYQFGLSETMAKRYAGTFGSMAKAFGFAEDQAADMSLALTGLAGDVASFYNIDQDAAYTKLKAVFSGETESLKELGIVMTQSALDQFALANGFGTTTARMSEQQKVALRYQFILSKLSDVSGDFARTSGGWANQVRILRLQFESLCATIGQGLIAAFTPAIKALNSFMGALIKAANTFKSFVFSLFGQQSQDMTAGAAAAFADVGAAAVGAGDSAADALGGMGDAAGGAAKDTKRAANEIQRALMGFDQINKLPDLSSDSGGGGSGSGSKGGAGGGAGGLGDVSSALKNTAYQVSGDSVLGDALADMLKHCWDRADFTQIGTVFGTKLRDALDSIPWDGIRGVLNKIAKSTATLLNGFLETQGLSDSVGKTIAEALNTAFEFVNTFLENFHFDSFGRFISSGIQTAFNKFDWGQVTRFISNRLKAVFDFGTGLLEGIDFKSLPRDLANAIKGAIQGFDFKGVFSSVGRFVGTALVSAIDLLSGIAGLVGDFFKGVADYFSKHIEEAKASGGTFADGIMNGIMLGFASIDAWIDKNIIQPFADGFTQAFDVKGAIDTAKATVLGFVDYVKDIKISFDPFNGGLKLEMPKDKMSVYIEGRMNDLKDEVPQQKKLVDSMTGNVTTANDKTRGQTKVEAYANLTRPIDNISQRGRTISTYASFDKPINNLSKIQRTIKTWADYRTPINSLNKNQRTIGTWARYSSPILALTKYQRTIGTWARFSDDPIVNLSKRQRTIDVFARFSGTRGRFATGGVIQNGIARQFASGGSVVNGISKLWDFLPKYAGGTTDAHGSLFVAGEAGPEVLGHIGGRTEILNQSQLAQTMHAAVTSGMVQAAHFMDRYTPRLVEIGRGIRQDTAQLTALATQAAQASGAGDTMEIIRLLRQILIALQSLDLDVELDGESLKRQIVRRINEHTRRTGYCEIII